MKRVLTIIFLLLLMLPISGIGHVNKQRKVYICTGSKSIRYHYKQNCRGLSNCGGSVISITINEAIKNGRTPCKICTDE